MDHRPAIDPRPWPNCAKSEQMGFAFKKSFIVGWGDCAPSGAVYYPNYFRWFDQSVWDLFDGAKLPIPELEQKYGIVGLPLMNLSCSFRAPCRLRSCEPRNPHRRNRAEAFHDRTCSHPR